MLLWPMLKTASKLLSGREVLVQSFTCRGEYFVYDLNDNTAPNIVQRVWDRKSFHYDNCAIAMITLFAVQTSEGWIE